MKTVLKTNRENTEGWHAVHFAIALDNMSDAEVEKIFSIVKERFPVEEKKMKERKRATRLPR